MTGDTRPSSAGANWLLRMRWGALGIVAASMLIATEALGVDLPVVPMWSLFAAGVASNAWLTFRREHEQSLGAYLVLDVAILTGLLYFSGGPTNPFSIIYVVYIAMSAVMLTPRWTWAIAGLSVLSFAGLFVLHSPNEHLGHGGHGDGFQAHLYGMLIALVLAVALITYFVSQLSIELRRRERELAEAEERTHRWSQLASIAGLAAGAAHELGTPLGTIAIAAKEMERQVKKIPGAEPLLDDAELIREELERCRVVLDRMASAGGEHVGETVSSFLVDGLLDDVRRRLGPNHSARWETDSGMLTMVAPRDALAQMIENIARNGFDACDAGRVTLEIRPRDEGVELHFSDQGRGMDAEIIKRATDPFFTTKQSGDRMGLGLFLARALIDSLGGELAIDSVQDRGTSIVVWLPQPS